MFVRVALLTLMALVATACGDGNDIDRAGPVSEYGVGVGECFDDPPDFEYDASALITIPCSQPHDNEVYVVGTASGSYPGEIELNELADDFCLAEFEGFIGLSWEDSIYDFIWVVPDRADWDSGERDVLCAAYDLDLAKITGTLEGVRE